MIVTVLGENFNPHHIAIYWIFRTHVHSQTRLKPTLEEAKSHFLTEMFDSFDLWTCMAAPQLMADIKIFAATYKLQVYMQNTKVM